MNPSARGCSEGVGSLNRSDDDGVPAAQRTAADAARRASQWQKQIDYGKNTLGYQTYLKLVPKAKRRRTDPRTPEIHRDMSKKRFDGQLRAWRRALHKYDDPDALQSERPAGGLCSSSCTGGGSRKRRNDGASVGDPSAKGGADASSRSAKSACSNNPGYEPTRHGLEHQDAAARDTTDAAACGAAGVEAAAGTHVSTDMARACTTDDDGLTVYEMIMKDELDEEDIVL